MHNFHLRPEGKTLEFKRELSLPKPMLKTIVAFDELPIPELGVEDLDLVRAQQLFDDITEQVARLLACLQDDPLCSHEAMGRVQLRHGPTRKHRLAK